MDTPEIQGIYTVNAFEFGDRTVVCAGPEKSGRSILLDLQSGEVETISDGPGGVMSIVPVPGRDDMLVSVMGLFPPFIGAEAGIFRHWKRGGKWRTDKVTDMPFAHRCDTVCFDGRHYLVSCTVSSHKDNPQDWSCPGCVYMTPLDRPEEDRWQAVLLDGHMTKNHGMLKSFRDGRESLMISSQEGVFEVVADRGAVRLESVFANPVSEFAFADLDGDGVDEMVCIEPFHGNRLNVYHRTGTGYELIGGDDLSFGHGLSAGVMGDKSYIAVGNRGESKQLSIYWLKEACGLQKLELEPSAGTTQTQFFRIGGRHVLLAANQLYDRASVYELY